jgi:hypothetical protein
MRNNIGRWSVRRRRGDTDRATVMMVSGGMCACSRASEDREGMGGAGMAGEMCGDAAARSDQEGEEKHCF